MKAEVSAKFLPEDIYQQIASGCKCKDQGNRWGRMPRTLRRISLNTSQTPDSEWWLMVGMKDPIPGDLPYHETVYGYTSPPDNLLAFERDYRNPWLVRSMLEFHFRAKSPVVLADIAHRVLADNNSKGSADQGAALAVIGYQYLNRQDFDVDYVETLIEQLKEFTDLHPTNAHLLRWKVSLGYLCAQLQKKIGLLPEALEALDWVSAASIDDFNPSLGTKIVDAAYEAGMLAFASGSEERAKEFWMRGIESAYALLRSPIEEYIGRLDYPHQFPTIVAVEFLDSAVRCIRALRWTASEYRRPLSQLYAVSSQNWKSMLEDRWSAMQSMEEVIRSVTIPLLRKPDA